jgi:hypothetical protein
LLVTTEVISHQAATPVTQKDFGILPSPAFAEVMDHRFGVFKGTCGVSPQLSAVSFATAWLENLHRGFIGVHHTVLEDVGFECIN